MLVLCLLASVHAFCCGVLVCLCSLCLWRSVFLLALCMSLLCALQCLHHLMLQLPCCRGTNVFAFGCWACIAVLGLRTGHAWCYRCQPSCLSLLSCLRLFLPLFVGCFGCGSHLGTLCPLYFASACHALRCLEVCCRLFCMLAVMRATCASQHVNIYNFNDVCTGRLCG